MPLRQKDGLTSYELPVKDHIYTITCDVSRGRGLDYSTMQIIDVTKIPYEQVATYRSNTIAPADFSEFIFRIANSYNKANVLIEINDIGEQVAHHLFYDFEYEGVLFTQNAGRLGKKVTFGFGEGQVDKGIRTTKNTKSVGCSILKLLIEQNKLVIRDKATVNELATFSQKGEGAQLTYCAEEGKHDDLAMGLVLFSWLSDQSFFTHLTDINTIASLRELSAEQVEAELTPFGYWHNGLDEHEQEQAVKDNIQVMPETKEMDENVSWDNWLNG